MNKHTYENESEEELKDKLNKLNEELKANKAENEYLNQAFMEMERKNGEIQNQMLRKDMIITRIRKEVVLTKLDTKRMQLHYSELKNNKKFGKYMVFNNRMGGEQVPILYNEVSSSLKCI